MSKLLSLKLRDDIFKEMETAIHRMKRPRNAYINEAVAHYNRLHQRRLLAREYERESAAVRDESMRVLAEFERLDDPATRID